jgi:hypothetical protein
MNKILDFVKGNLVVVISVVLMLAVLPTGLIFSGKWNAKVHEQADSAYKGEQRKITSAGKVNYSLPSVLEGEEDLSETRAPNQVVTRFYKARKEQREQQVQEVIERGTEFNRGHHVELVEGILPKAPDDRTQKRLGREMAEAIAGTISTSSVYQRKLQRLNAGSPMDAETLVLTLEELKTREEQRYQNASADGKMTPIQIEEMTKNLSARRLGEYIGRAKALTFYCSTDAFVDQSAQASGGRVSNQAKSSEYSVIPSKVPLLSTIDEAVVFNWLWDYWLVSDVLDAVSLANSNPVTGAMAVPDAPIKRVESIRLSKLTLGEQASASVPDDTQRYLGGGGGRDQRSTSGGQTGGQGVGGADDSDAPFTGRVGGGPQSAFDVRTIEMVIVASSKDLPRFIDALGKTNYMTVIDVDLDQVDVWGDLEQGYYYGDEHVVRASIVIESVWLRSWLKPKMPDRIKTALGIPIEELLDDADG